MQQRDRIMNAHTRTRKKKSSHVAPARCGYFDAHFPVAVYAQTDVLQLQMLTTPLLDERDFVGVGEVNLLFPPSQRVGRATNWPGTHLASCLNSLGFDKMETMKTL